MMDEKTRKIIENNPVALATINQEGKPHVIAFVKIKDDKIIVINNYMVNTTSNIKKNPNVSLAVWNKKLGNH